MELAEQIRNRRTELGLSQDEVAEAIYVSRQTISNWETDKTYPDVESLLRLSVLFDTSVDELIKGDAATLERAVALDSRKMHWLTWAMIASIVLAVAFFVGLSAAWHEPSGIGRMSCGNIAGAVIFVPLYVIGMGCAIAIERLKKRHNLVTYREIDAFLKGEPVEEVRRGGDFSRQHPALSLLLKFLAGAAAGAFIGIVIYKLIG